MNIAVLLSGRGSNFMAIHRAVSDGEIRDSKIVSVISSRPGAKGLEYAIERGLNGKFLSPKDYASPAQYDTAIAGELEANGAEVVCLAGYMRIATEVLVDRYYGRIMNIHPSLLPAFQGLDAQKQALEYGVKLSGCTVHFVDNGVDTGPIIAQRGVDVYDNDTVKSLSERILEQEHLLYPYVLSLFEQGKIKVEGRRVYINQ
ncbi:MAG: phosphoribosylglycinamide formyltransferase [Deferribacteraceae bacterium]|nr:phosphoribosylglycinamide formyltransferase [Deferribacteraceae bacterium]